MSENEVFTIDDLGNRTNVKRRDASDETYSVDNLTNRYNGVRGNNLEYDEAGNLTKDADGYEYRYDYENYLIKIRKAGQVKAEYAGVGFLFDSKSFGCSTICRRNVNQSQRTDSNRQPLVYKTRALPLSYVGIAAFTLHTTGQYCKKIRAECYFSGIHLPSSLVHLFPCSPLRPTSFLHLPPSLRGAKRRGNLKHNNQFVPQVLPN